jgi:hypothetical protein
MNLSDQPAAQVPETERTGAVPFPSKDPAFADLPRSVIVDINHA